MTRHRVTIDLTTQDNLTVEQVQRLIQTVLPIDVAIEIENDDGGFDYIQLDSLTLEQGT
jgi:acyl carrier protein